MAANFYITSIETWCLPTSKYSFIKTFDALIRNNFLLLFSDVHLHLTFSFAYFNFLMTFTNLHFTPIMQSFCVTMTECNFWWLVSVSLPLQHRRSVPATNTCSVICHDQAFLFSIADHCDPLMSPARHLKNFNLRCRHPAVELRCWLQSLLSQSNILCR